MATISNNFKIQCPKNQEQPDQASQTVRQNKAPKSIPLPTPERTRSKSVSTFYPTDDEAKCNRPWNPFERTPSNAINKPFRPQLTRRNQTIVEKEEIQFEFLAGEIAPCERRVPDQPKAATPAPFESNKMIVQIDSFESKIASKPTVVEIDPFLEGGQKTSAFAAKKLFSTKTDLLPTVPNIQTKTIQRKTVNRPLRAQAEAPRDQSVMRVRGKATNDPNSSTRK